MMRRIALVPGIAAVVTVMVISASPAEAKPSPQPTSASLVADDSSGSSTVAPVFGSSVRLTATFGSMKAVPEVSVICTSDGEEVYGDVQTGGGSASPWTSSWTLWSQTWLSDGGAPATCDAQLYYYTWQGKTETGIVYLSSANFDAT